MSMGRLCLVSALLALTLGGCGAASSERNLGVPVVREAPVSAQPVAENTLDRTIRVQLEKSIADEPSLKTRGIRFTVDGGDVVVAGEVQSDAESEKANEIAINVPGVRSVSNALRVLP